MNDPALDPSVLEKLYHSGAWLCLAILVAFFGLRAAATRVAWLKEDHRAAWVSAFLGGFALLVVPATQGTTPNLSMIIGVLVTVAAIHADPKKTPEEQKQAQAGSIRLGVMIAIAAIGGALLFGCSTATRQKDAGYALATTIAISSQINRQNNKLIEAGISGSANTIPEGEAKLKKYQAARDKVVKDLPIVLDAEIAFLQFDTDASWATAQAAFAQLSADVATMKGAQ